MHAAEAGKDAEDERNDETGEGKLKGDECTLEQLLFIFKQDGVAVHGYFAVPPEMSYLKYLSFTFLYSPFSLMTLSAAFRSSRNLSSSLRTPMEMPAPKYFLSFKIDPKSVE